jgi:hypothetical protein
MTTRLQNRRHRACVAIIVSVAWIMPDLAAMPATAAIAPRPAPPPLACKASAGIGPLIAGKDVLLVGEVHGTAESPAFVAETACAALDSGRAVSVALEIPVAEQARLAAFVASAGTAADRAAVLSGDFWRDPYQDGRASVAMVELLERLRTFRQAGRPIAVVAIDPGPGMDGQERERSMADRLRAQVAAGPHDLLIVLTGNFHTRLKPRGSYAYMGSVLSQGNPALRVAALDVAYSGGSAWICQSADAAGCKPARLGNKAGAAKGEVVTFPALDNAGYTGVYGVGELSASPPAAIPAPAPAPTNSGGASGPAPISRSPANQQRGARCPRR